MSLLAVGINHKTAPIHIRERLSFSSSEMVEAYSTVREQMGLSEMVMLSTCNRTEIYLCHAQPEPLLKWWASEKGLTLDELENYAYIHEDRAAIEHLMKVASGIDSLVMGEPQVFGQLKKAYQQSQELGGVGKVLSKWFEQTFSTAKQIRTDTEVGKDPVSVAYAAICLARQIFASIDKLKICIVGAGDTSQLVVEHLKGIGAQNIVVVNRTYERAVSLAESFGGRATPWDLLDSVIVESDMVISSTLATEPVVKYNMLKSLLSKRRHKPLLIIDLAVPRDIEPRVSDFEEVFLYTLDDLEGIISENKEKRHQAVTEAEKIIHHEASKYLAWYRNHAALSVVVKYRSQVEKIREDSLSEALRAIDNGQDEKSVLKWLAHDLTNKWMHKPTIQLKDAIMNEDTDTVDAICQLFEINIEE